MQESQLEALGVFKALPRREIRYLAGSFKQKEVPAGTLLYREGELGDFCCVLLDGKVEIVKAMGSEGERNLGVRLPGDILGEMSLLLPEGRRTASVRSLTPIRVLELGQADFDALMKRRPALALEVMRGLSLRLRDANEATIRDLSQKNRQLTQAYEALEAAQAQIIEKEKLEHELRLAREIQMSLLPNRSVSLAGFDLGARILPARAVGGDFYDFIPLSENSLGICIGDVSDKGVPAAIFMALCVSLLRAEAQRSDSPASVLREVNRHLCSLNRSGMFVTMLYGLLNGEDRTYIYARAGHEIPILMDARGQITFPDWDDGQPLGLLPNPDLDVKRLVIPPKSRLILHTDGMTDVMDAERRPVGEDRLQDSLRANIHLSVQEMCDRVVEDLLALQAGESQLDDMTLLAIHSEGGRFDRR